MVTMDAVYSLAARPFDLKLEGMVVVTPKYQAIRT